ncbi:LysR family transcriptional regulator [Sodalis ligni]|jgi:DNA-binding transcriptional LysR family regulator|uniref:DNA-binding transcriptional LysR family regulator n=1 Tax=Sodalis ligni TaxID=2697027 RepID=A0A4R1NPT6_9GAMM|nr:LysR family transcriptional regulator [Sodalis ligni]TCL06746.1 DNA-binding transcriptional LysR family regulator [Sodalis ligni]
MGKIEDMALLVEVVDAGGLAAAGRRMNLSPATMTARLKALEERYQTRLFNRSTRSIALTRAGEEFYHSALRVLEEMNRAEETLTQKEGVLSGTLRISAPSDFGRQYLSPALLAFSAQYPQVKSSVYLCEDVVDLITHRLDMSIRFGNLPDSNLVMRLIKPNHRVLVASPGYLEKYGMPQRPEDLHQQRCLVMECRGTLFNEWRFETQGEIKTLRVQPVTVFNDGALLRQWVLAGAGIASKSWWDVKRDVEQGRLQVLFADTFIGFNRNDKKQVGLQFVYPQRRFQPLQVSTFSTFFIDWLENA